MCAICPRQSLALGTPQVMAPQPEQGSTASLEGCFTLTITILTGMRVQPAQTLGQGAGGRMHLPACPITSFHLQPHPARSRQAQVGLRAHWWGSRFLLRLLSPVWVRSWSTAWHGWTPHCGAQPGFGTGPSQGGQGHTVPCTLAAFQAKSPPTCCMSTDRHLLVSMYLAHSQTPSSSWGCYLLPSHPTAPCAPTTAPAAPPAPTARAETKPVGESTRLLATGSLA